LLVLIKAAFFIHFPISQKVPIIFLILEAIFNAKKATFWDD